MIEHINTGDPQWLSKTLHHASRRNDLEGVLTVCEGLFSVPVFPDIDPTVSPLARELSGFVEAALEHTPQIREALRLAVVQCCEHRWAPVNGTLDEEDAWLKPWKCNRCRHMAERGFSDSLRTVPERLPRQATRIANLARLLPNPQPTVCFDVACRGPACSSECASRKPASTHALCLYIDAMRLVKGEGDYLSWLHKEHGWLVFSSTAHQHDEVWVSPPDNPLVKVFKEPSGRIECGPICPPLPRLEVAV